MAIPLDAGIPFELLDIFQVSGKQHVLDSQAIRYVDSPRDPPSREDWERFKLTIISKYVGMNIPLHGIVREMGSGYGFKATQRMYKQRFTEWGVYKYRRSAEKRVAKYRSQNPEGAESVAMTRIPSSMTSASLSSTEVDDADDWTHMLETQDVEIHDDETCGQSALCAHRRCIRAFLDQLAGNYTIEPSLQSNISDPLHCNSSPRMGSVNRVLFHVRQFSQSWMTPANSHPHHIADAAAKAAMITSGLVRHCSHRSSLNQCERCTWAEFDFGLAMLEDQQTDAALASFELGCRLAYLLLSSPSKLFIRNLIMAFGSTRWEQFEPFRRKLLDYFALMASVVLGDQHPITIILDNVSCDDTLAESAESALSIMAELFERNTHAAHSDVLLIKRSQSIILRRQRQYDVSESILLAAIRDSENYDRYDCKETRRCLRRLGHLYMERERYTEAEEVFQRILDIAPESVYSDNWIPDEISVYTYQHLAKMSYDMGNHNRCRYWFIKELDAAVKRWGVDDEYPAECLQLAHGDIPSLRSAVDQYPDILGQLETRSFKRGIVISKARWCAVRNLI